MSDPESFYQGEVNDSYLYQQLARNEKNEKTKARLLELSDIEKSHSEFWAAEIRATGNEPVPKIKKFGILYLSFLKSLFGISFVINYLEKSEVKGIVDYLEYTKTENDVAKKKRLNEIINDEKNHEAVFIKMSQEFSLGTEKTRDAIYGMSDGLIEVLAGIAGLTNVLLSGFFILLGGLIFAISGMISMTIGAFLSQKAKIQLSNGQGEYSSLHSARNTALFYAVGSFFPIFPFLFFGLGKYVDLAISVILTIVVEVVAASVISISSYGNLKKDVSTSLLLVVAGFVATFIIGLVVHHFVGNIL